MYHFSKTSLKRLDECDRLLKEVFMEVIKHFDCTILTGYRSEKDQNNKFLYGKSKVKYPDSKHNTLPSRAIDAAPYPINWNDRERFTLFAGYVLGIAASRGIRLRWGGDWDSDTEVKDNSFDDLLHFEIIG